MMVIPGMLKSRRLGGAAMWVFGLISVAGIAMVAFGYSSVFAVRPTATPTRITYEPRKPTDTSGYSMVVPQVKPWKPTATLQEISDNWKNVGYRLNETVEQYLKNSPNTPENMRIGLSLQSAILMNYEGQPAKAYQKLETLRTEIEPNDFLSAQWLHTIIYIQGVSAFRRGENDNCVMCRGESSCILPISAAAVHRNTKGSRTAIKHFTEYLTQFPNDLEVKWLLNLAHMTLGEYPQKVNPNYLVSLDRYTKSEFDIGKFRDVGHVVGVNRFNQAGGVIMEDFDKDGLLDFVITTFDPTEHMCFFRNKGDGTFEDRTEAAGLKDQLGGLFCVQTDIDNDGNMDIFIPRGAWLSTPMRPSLLRNRGDGTFSDVTEQAGLLDPVNSNSATWADYDNDGFLDVFICCEQQTNRLYHNKGNGTFEEVSSPAGLSVYGQNFCKGANWIDYDNDRYPDLFMNYLNGYSHLFHNNRDGTFTEATIPMGVDGPKTGFSCWAWDYDNDGWLDIFATCYDRTLGDVVKGLIGEKHSRNSNRLFRNREGRGFEDVTKKAGLDMVLAAMGSNFADFDNDGFLDMYLGTGEPSLATLVPNRMFKNVGGERFAEITGSSGTGHLQKGHGVACGDWDRDGDNDIYIEMGGAINGDKYHNVLFQNPGQGNHSLTVKLIGKKSNRLAIGARIKAVVAAKDSPTIHRHISTGSSFGANALEQSLGLGKANRVETLEVYWPTSDTKQVFHNIDGDQIIEITEFAEDYRRIERKPISLPK